MIEPLPGYGRGAREDCDLTSDRLGSGPAWRALLVLLLVYIFNLIDRQILGVLAAPIKADLGLTDTQLGLLGGLAFALFYTGLGIPIAWLADRKRRTSIITIAVTVWSIFTALCGAAHGFWQLFIARMGVGVGEAGGVAPSYSLIADYFPPKQRARALAIFSFGIPIGSALGIFFGGWIASNLHWRAAFLIIGLAGLPVALLVWTNIPEPPRGGLEEHDRATESAPPFLSVARYLAAKPSFWLMSFGASACSVLGFGLPFWLPSLFQRSFGLSLIEVAYFYGSILLVGGIAGIWLGGWIGDRVGRSDPGNYLLIPAISFLLAAPAYAIGLFATDLWLAFFLFVIPQALGLAWTGPTINSVQHIVPPEMRATASASFLFINNLIGIGLGSVFLGFMSDQMAERLGQESLRYSILYGLLFYVLSALLFFVGSRWLKRDWYHPIAA